MIWPCDADGHVPELQNGRKICANHRVSHVFSRIKDEPKGPEGGRLLVRMERKLFLISSGSRVNGQISVGVLSKEATAN